ncbi:hypothetical protein K1719_032992 [Acacia pycnantha]|nr:hypothetical protein K1719_032992 [Acacia pycnantha]
MLPLSNPCVTQATDERPCKLHHLTFLIVAIKSSSLMVSQCSLSDLLLHCCVDDAPDIRQSAFALLGNLARVMCPIHLHPHLSQFLEASAKQLESSKVKEAVSVANNACWAIGELAVKVHQEISPIVLTVISCLVPVLQHAEVPFGLGVSVFRN